eukprot:TRINITY_DN3376_c0_g1_i2.p1 TRINITY_DN3376_c0_g1~~TRINITY_DN3376_c0_g1_i2.p1  ORF type:complete len:461 (+),score=112.68 TRINITY_DN3376_c0_g1_i2:35-1384(+)
MILNNRNPVRQQFLQLQQVGNSTFCRWCGRKRLSRLRIIRQEEQNNNNSNKQIPIDLDSVIDSSQNEEVEKQQEVQEKEELGQENSLIQEDETDRMFGIQRYEQQYKQFNLDGCDFLIAENEEGMLDLNDVFVYDHEVEIYARPIVEENGGTLPDGPRYFKDLPWQEEKSADSLKQEFNEKLTVRRIILTLIKSHEPYELDLAKTYYMDAQSRRLVVPVVEWKALSDDPVLRIRENKITVEDEDAMLPPGWPIMMHMARSQGMQKEADKMEQLFDFAASAIMTPQDWEDAMFRFQRAEFNRQEQREKEKDDVEQEGIDEEKEYVEESTNAEDFFQNMDFSKFLDDEQETTEKLLQMIMTNTIPEEKEVKVSKVEEEGEEEEAVEIVSEEGKAEEVEPEEEEELDFEFEEVEEEEEFEHEEEDMEGMGDFEGDQDMEMEMEVDQPTVDLI